MDKALGAAVRASLNRSGGSAKDRAAALLALQLRVAALLEDWLKKVQNRVGRRGCVCGGGVRARVCWGGGWLGVMG